MLDSLQLYLPWIVTYSLILAGLIGAFIPLIPSHLLILLAGGAHYWMLRDESGLGIVSLIVLSFLLILSQTLETFSGAMGSKWFGGSKWGTLGALTGLIVGLFFPPLGFVIGPLLGALLFEKLFAKKTIMDATSSGVGSAVGTLSGLLIRLIIAVVMVTYLVLDIHSIS